MSGVRDSLNGLALGIILSAADKIGINPILLGRQSAKLLAPMLSGLVKQFLGVPTLKNMEEFLKELEVFSKNFGVLGKEPELNYTGNILKIKVVECYWKEMSKYGKSMGYKACPLCIAAMMMMSVIEGLGLNQVLGLKSESNGAACEVELALEQK
ncbi:MAG: hypothetical protein QXO71_03640 [Candidatus Jordarchaeaceae archaeon]